MTTESAVRLDIGAGEMKQYGWTSVDVQDHFKPDIIASVTDLPYEDGSVDEARCLHVLEHLERKDIIRAFNEIWRVLKVGGELLVEVPIFPYWEAIADPTHYSFFVPQSFWYFTRDDYKSFRKMYGIKPWKLTGGKRNALGSVLASRMEKVEDE
jgi:SAM-dependent methyltransferase